MRISAVAGLVLGSVCFAQTPLYKNPSAALDHRVEDLLGRMTLEEKISQLMNDSPAIERLDVPRYNWWNESLHGVARAGRATVFPQAIGLAATWDTDLMFRVATTISDEARAKYHQFLRRDKHDIYQGLTFWTPNINLFRDPRWGRGMETYGEDPYLTGQMAVAFLGDVRLQQRRRVAGVRESALARRHSSQGVGIYGIRGVGLRSHRRHLSEPQAGTECRGGRRAGDSGGDRPELRN
jgi:hypothetical protein